MPLQIPPVALITVTRDRILFCGDMSLPCAIGRGGIRMNKREGDGATPAGRYPLRRVLFRQDRIPALVTRLPAAGISRRDGWCTESRNNAYNRQITLPHPGQHEELWREDELYDVIVVIGYNDSPALPDRGSAIFLHVARPRMTPTDGCVAVPLDAVLEIVRRCDVNTVIEIGP
jgi:L,D-peptidoglycan transpeptidase YkuD (ErfK/YbiS/YcfS/YnhG family)